MLSHEQFNKFNLEQNYQILCTGENRIVTRVRKQTIYQYGVQIGDSRYPRLFDNYYSKIRMFHRTFVKSRTGNFGHH